MLDTTRKRTLRYPEILDLYKKARKETNPVHGRSEETPDSRRFKIRLRSVNHLHHDGSQLIEGPVAQFMEEAYLLWTKIRDGFNAFHDWLYPRRDVIWGTRKDSRVVGRITFAKREDQFLPIHHIHLEIWGRTKMGAWRKFSEGETDHNGYFALPLDMMAVHAYAMKSLRLEIYHTGGFRFENGKAVHEHELFETRKISRSNIVGLDFSMGIIQLFYWEYRDDTQIPRVIIKDHDLDAPQKYSTGRIDAISEQFIPVEMKSRALLRHIREGRQVRISDIQDAFPQNLTMYMEQKMPGLTRSDEWFGMRQMNGMYASYFDRDPDRPELYWMHYHWSSYDHNKNWLFPDVSIRYTMQENGYLIPVEIDLIGALHKHAIGTKPVKRVTPADGQTWEAAKRIARVTGALATQVDRHFAETHSNVEQYALAVYRSIRKNPIGGILFPHLKEDVLINHTADEILIGKNGWISKSTALSPKGLADRVRDVMGTLDWRNWRPMEPISEAHMYAKASWLFWDMLVEFVDEFVEGHREEIIQEWHEIYAMSNDLVQHAVPKFLCGYLTKKIDPDAIEAGEKSVPGWFGQSGRMDLSIKRPVIHGIEKAVSPVTINSRFNPQSNDMDNLKQMCAYVIWQATFGHYWANSKQYDDIGEIRYNSLGIRFGDSELGALGPETDDSIAPDLENAVKMMWWANMLSRTGYGFIMKNEDNDVHPRLIEMLKERESAFAALDVDIYNIQSRTNI